MILFFLGIFVALFTLWTVDFLLARHRIWKYMGKFPSSPRSFLLGNLRNLEGMNPSGECSFNFLWNSIHPLIF